MTDAPLTAESEALRFLLWTQHMLATGHYGYGDDGEMQCHGVDYKRASVAALAPSGSWTSTPCRTCGHDKGAHFLAEGPCNAGRCNCIEVRPQPQEDA